MHIERYLDSLRAAASGLLGYIKHWGLDVDDDGQFFTERPGAADNVRRELMRRLDRVAEALECFGGPLDKLDDGNLMDHATAGRELVQNATAAIKAALEPGGLPCLDIKVTRALEQGVDVLGVFATEGQPTATDVAVPTGANITRDEANTVAMELAKKNPDFVNGIVAEWAEAIRQATGKTCSTSTVKKTKLWEETMKLTGRGRTKGASPKAVSLTPRLESVVGTGGRDEELNELIAQHHADFEPGPFDDEEPKASSKPKQFKRV